MARNDRRTIGWWLEAMERTRSESSASYNDWEHIADHHQGGETSHSIWVNGLVGHYVAENLDRADAKLIEQAVNMLPRLIAAIRVAVSQGDEELIRDVADALAGKDER